MQPKFKPPVDEKEFRERAEKVTLDGARSVLSSLQSRRADTVKPYDEEIKYWNKVVEYKQKIADGQLSIGDDL